MIPTSGNTQLTPPPFTKRRPLRVLTRPETPPTRIRDSRGIFELTKALKNADKALIVWTLRGWIAHNQAKKKGYRDGHTWTFNSLDRWQAKHFPWLTVKQLATLMRQLVAQGVVIRTRRNVHTCYWYRVNETVLSSLCASLPPAAVLMSQSSGLKDKTSEHKTEVVKEEKEIQQQSTAVTTHKSNGGVVNQSPSKDSQKGVSPLFTDLVRFGVKPYVARWLESTYVEDDIRYVLRYARTQSSLTNPPGYVVKELELGEAGVLGLRGVVQARAVIGRVESAQAYKPIKPGLDPAYLDRRQAGDLEFAARLFGAGPVLRE